MAPTMESLAKSLKALQSKVGSLGKKVSAHDERLKKLEAASGEDPPPPQPPTGSAPSVSYKLGTYTSTNRPTPLWRPYADSAPFNTKVASGRSVHPNSGAIINRLVTESPLAHHYLGDPTRDYGVAVYYSKPSDPEWSISCVENWGPNELDNVKVRVPNGAIPSGQWPLGSPDESWDSHFTFVDQERKLEVDLWDVRAIHSGSRLIETSWGGMTELDGQGGGSGAVSSHFGSLAGLVRWDELNAGEINHSMCVGVPCVNGKVWPATGEAGQCAGRMPTSDRMANGQQIQLNMTIAEIDALRLPKHLRAIAVCLATYGAYVNDTTEQNNLFVFRLESRAGYVSQGLPDPGKAFAQSLGIPPTEYNHQGLPEYEVDFTTGIPWNRLRVLNPAR